MRLLSGLFILAFLFLSYSALPAFGDQVSRDSIVSDQGIELKTGDRLITPGRFRPPVEITIVAKTASTNLRLSYAAEQVIFNWEMDQSQLRIDGGPAAGKHKPGMGMIPIDTYVTIKWTVMPDKQTILVDGMPRFEDEGDYSAIDRAVAVYPAEGSTITVKSIVVKELPDTRFPTITLESWRHDRPTMPAALKGAARAPTELFSLASPSVYIVSAKGGGSDVGGSAVAISDRILLTNCHVVFGHTDIRLTQHGTSGGASLAYIDREHDRCFLRSDTMAVHPVPGLRRFADLHVGETVYSIGTPDGQ
jgi:hypothetical protein